MQTAFEFPPTQLTVNQAAGVTVTAAAAAAAGQPAKASPCNTGTQQCGSIPAAAAAGLLALLFKCNQPDTWFRLIACSKE
jgi:hypothetical protein